MAKNKKNSGDVLYIGKDEDYYDMAEIDLEEAEFDYEIIMNLEGTGKLKSGFIRTCAIRFANTAEKYMKSIVADYIVDSKYNKQNDWGTSDSILRKHKVKNVLKFIQQSFPDFPYPDLNMYGKINNAHQSYEYPLNDEEKAKNRSHIINIDLINEFRGQAHQCKEVVDFIRQKYIKSETGEIKEKEEEYTEEKAFSR